MKYYSEITNKLYESETDLTEAELKAKEVEDAYKVADAAQKDADRLLNEFLRDYGSFHSTIREVKPKFTFTSFLESFFS